MQEKNTSSALYIGASVLIANCLLFVIQFAPLSIFKSSFFVHIKFIVSLFAVFPLDFFVSYLREFISVQIVWIILVVFSSAGLLKFSAGSRKIFILCNIFHFVFMNYCVYMKFGSNVFLEYFFKLYFCFVVSGTYVGFLTTVEAQEEFHFGSSFSLYRWLKQRTKKVSPPKAEDYFNLGIAYAKLNRYKDSINVLKKAMEVDEENPEIRLSLGKTYLEQKEYHAAVNVFKDALLMTPDHVEILYNLALAYKKAGCDQEAISTFLKVRVLQPKHLHVFRDLGETYMSSGNFVEAIQAFQRAVKIDPKDFYSYYQIGLIYMDKLEKYQESYEAFKTAIRLKADLPEIHFQMGLLNIKRLHYKDAVRTFKEVIRLDKDNLKAYYHLGFSYAMLKDFDSAKRQYNYLRNLDSDLADNLALVVNP